MNKIAYITFAAMLMIASSSAWAEMPAGQHDKMVDPKAAEDHKAEEALMFKNRKDEMLLRLNNRIAEIQSKKDCIQAAGDKESLFKCMPQGGQGGNMMMGGEGHMMMGGPGGSGGQGGQHGAPMMMGGQQRGQQQPPAAPGGDPHGH